MGSSKSHQGSVLIKINTCCKIELTVVVSSTTLTGRRVPCSHFQLAIGNFPMTKDCHQINEIGCIFIGNGGFNLPALELLRNLVGQGLARTELAVIISSQNENLPVVFGDDRKVVFMDTSTAPLATRTLGLATLVGSFPASWPCWFAPNPRLIRSSYDKRMVCSSGYRPLRFR